MNNLDLTFLTSEQIAGDDMLGILDIYDTRCAITDFSIILGGYVGGICTCEGKTLKNRTGNWWTKSYNDRQTTICVNDDGIFSVDCFLRRSTGGRPAVSYSSISAYATNKRKNCLGILEVEYGEYPQTIVDYEFLQELEYLYKKGCINKTGKTYTTDSVIFRDYNESFKLNKHLEYEYQGKKYIRVIANENSKNELNSDNRRFDIGKPYWIEVEPIVWLVDEKSNIALSKKIVFAGIQFQCNDDRNTDFKYSNIKLFMDNYFSKEIIPSNTYVMEQEEQNQRKK